MQTKVRQLWTKHRVLFLHFHGTRQLCPTVVQESRLKTHTNNTNIMVDTLFYDMEEVYSTVQCYNADGIRQHCLYPKLDVTQTHHSFFPCVLSHLIHTHTHTHTHTHMHTHTHTHTHKHTHTQTPTHPHTRTHAHTHTHTCTHTHTHTHLFCIFVTKDMKELQQRRETNFYIKSVVLASRGESPFHYRYAWHPWSATLLRSPPRTAPEAPDK